MSGRKSDRKVEKVAWFMANFQCVDLDDASFERIRELLSHCRGSKTRVALSKTDGWKSGKNSLLHKHKKKKVPLACIHNLIQDEKFINVLLCVFAVQVRSRSDRTEAELSMGWVDPWVGLGWVSYLVGWVRFGSMKWTHGQLCTEVVSYHAKE